MLDLNRLTFAEYLKSIGVEAYTLDHGALSPSGSVSRRSATAYQEHQERKRNAYYLAEYTYQGLVNSGDIVDPSGKFTPAPPLPSPSEVEAKRLLHEADELDGLADRGMSPRKYRKHADKLRQQAQALTEPKQ